MDILTFSIVISILVCGGFAAYYFLKPSKKHRTDSVYTDALNAMVRGEKGNAIRLLRTVVKQDSDHVDAYLQLGNIMREENPQQAVKIHQSLTVRPGLLEQFRIELHKALALDYNQAGAQNLAKREAEQLLRVDRRNLWALEFLLEIAEKERTWAQAVKLIKMIQKIRNIQDKSQLGKFQVYEGMDKLEGGDRKGAFSALKKAIKIAPDLGLPYLRLGDLYALERDLIKAIENWERFAFLTPAESSRVYIKIESALFDLGRFSEVENFYQKVIEKDPANLEALTKLANVLEEKGENKSALNLVEGALAQNNDSLHARLMKLKLSLHQVTPSELGHQIDIMIDILTEKNDGT